MAWIMSSSINPVDLSLKNVDANREHKFSIFLLLRPSIYFTLLTNNRGIIFDIHAKYALREREREREKERVRETRLSASEHVLPSTLKRQT
jgi:hypothetical protein